MFEYIAYRISSNRCMLPSNSHRPRIVAADTIHSTCMQIFADDSHQANTRAVYVVGLVSMADYRTERLRLLLTVVTVSLYRSYVP